MACLRRRRGHWVVDYRDPSGRRIVRAVDSKAQGAIELGNLASAPRAIRSDVLLRDWLERWMAQGQVLWRHSTASQYRWAVDQHIVTRLGGIKLRDVTRDQIRGLLVVLLETLSRKSTRIVLGVLHTALQTAVEDGLLVVNPAAVGRSLLARVAPLPATAEERIRALTRMQLGQLLEAAKAEGEGYVLLYLLSRTGMRVGEAIGLQWGDLDWRGHSIRVARSRVGTRRVEAPKSGRARTVDMSSSLQALLLSHDTATKGVWLARGKPRPVWLWTTQSGATWHRSRVTRLLHRALTRAGLPHHSPHDLRHTYASLLLQQGESPEYVRRQLGHSDIRLTTGLYGRWLPVSNRAAVDRLDDAPIAERQGD